MKQITLEFSNEHELLRLLEILRQFDVRIVQNLTKRKNKKQSPADFYQQFKMNISEKTFNREEANER
jgi:hypothetical protein